MDSITDCLGGYTLWQYGSGSPASNARHILGLVVIKAVSDNSRNVLIRHLVLDVSSQWVIGKNVTKHANIVYVYRNAVEFQVEGVTDCFSIIEHKFLSYVPLDEFAPNSNEEIALTCLNDILSGNYSWKQTKAIIDKVHCHLRGHANYINMRLLLERNNLWSDMIADYVGRLVEPCVACHSTAPPQPSRKVSISPLSRNFNEVLCIDHFISNLFVFCIAWI